MQVSTQQAKPPYVTFEYRALEGRDESGRPITRDVAFAVITPAGSRDRIEKIAEEWLEHIQAESRISEDRFPPTWARHYREMFQLWKSGQEIPLEGTSIRNWPVLTPGQVKTLTTWNVLTVEQLAQANEETINRIGMGARLLVQQAKDYLASREGPGKLVSELAAARVKVDGLATENASLRERLLLLENQVKALSQLGAQALHGGSPGIEASDLLPDD